MHSSTEPCPAALPPRRAGSRRLQALRALSNRRRTRHSRPGRRSKPNSLALISLTHAPKAGSPPLPRQCTSISRQRPRGQRLSLSFSHCTTSPRRKAPHFSRPRRMLPRFASILMQCGSPSVAMLQLAVRWCAKLALNRVRVFSLRTYCAFARSPRCVRSRWCDRSCRQETASSWILRCGTLVRESVNASHNRTSRLADDAASADIERSVKSSWCLLFNYSSTSHVTHHRNDTMVFVVHGFL